MKSIRYAQPYVDEADHKALMQSIDQSFTTRWFGFGEKCKEFEVAFSKFIGVKHAVFVNSGSSANLLGIAAMNATGRARRGAKVMTTACTFPTTLNPLLLYGMEPVFVDIELPTWSVNLTELAEAAEKGADLLVLPHLNGIPHRMDEVQRIVKKHGLRLVEDACDALGSAFAGNFVGTMGEIGAFSFYVAHHMTTGEGGMVVTNDDQLAEVLESLRDWGRASRISTAEVKRNRSFAYQAVSADLPKDYELRYTYSNIGFNLKPLEMQGAWGLCQLKKLPEIIRKRKRNFEKLFSALRDFRDTLILPEPSSKTNVSWFWFPLVVKEDGPFTRKEIVKFLEERGIETRPLLAGNILKQPAYQRMKHRTIGNLDNTRKILEGGFIVGVHPGLSESDLQHMIASFEGFFETLPR